MLLICIFFFLLLSIILLINVINYNNHIINIYNLLNIALCRYNQKICEFIQYCAPPGYTYGQIDCHSWKICCKKTILNF